MPTYDSIEAQIAIYEDLYAINPNRYEVNFRLGLLYGESKINVEKALTHLERAVKIKPDSFQAYKAIGAGYGEKGDYEKSIQYTKIATELNPKDEQLKINLGLTYKFLGAEKFNKDKDYETALKMFLEGLKYIPKDYSLYSNIATTYQVLNQPDKANEYMSKAVQLQKELQSQQQTKTN